MWTGRQALERGLVDHIGGLHKALNVAVELSDLPPEWLGTGPLSGIRVQTFKEPRSGLPFPFGSASSSISTLAMGVLNSLFGLNLISNHIASTPVLLPDSSTSSSGGGVRRSADNVLAICDESVACTDHHWLTI